VFAIGSAFTYLLFFRECATPVMSRDSVLQAFPRVTAGDKRWVRGYLRLSNVAGLSMQGINALAKLIRLD